MTTASAVPRRRTVRERHEPPAEAFETWLLLQQSYLLTYKAIDQALTKVGVSYAQAAVLIALARSGEPLPLSRLARTLVQEAQSITSLIDRLERRGLVQRVPAQNDRRVIKVALTPAGEQTLMAALPLATEAARTAFADLQDDGLGALHGHLRSVRARSAATLGIELGTTRGDRSATAGSQP